MFGPVVALALNLTPAAPGLALRPLDLSPSCVTVATRAMPLPDSPGPVLEQRANCGGTAMTIQIEVFSPRSTAAPVNAARRRVTHMPDAEDVSEGPLTTASGEPILPWRLFRANQPAFVAAAGLWIEGEPAAPGMAMRLRMARDSVTGVNYPPVLVTITPVADWPHVDPRRRAELERQLRDLFQAHPGIGDQIRAMASGGG